MYNALPFANVSILTNQLYFFKQYFTITRRHLCANPLLIDMSVST